MIDEPRHDRKNPVLKVLTIVVALLVIGIAAGTLFGLGTGSRQRALARGEPGVDEGSNIFNLGQVRTRTSDLRPSLVAALISFPYPVAATSFKEELDKKAPALREAAIRFLSGKKAEDLHPAYEGTVKAGLRDAFNALLSLGSVKEVWLSDFALLQ